MVKMLRYIAIVAYFTGALGQFYSTYKCEDIEKEITLNQQEPVTMDQVTGTWHDVTLLKWWPYVKIQQCAKNTISNEKGLDGKIKLQQKYTLNYEDGTTAKTTLTQDTTMVGRFTSEEFYPFWIIKTGVDFTKHALMLQCLEKGKTWIRERGNYKDLVFMSMMSRTETLSDEDQKIIMEKIKTIADLGKAEFVTCPPSAGTASANITGTVTTTSTVSASTTSDAAMKTKSISINYAILLSIVAAIALKVLNVR